MTMVGFMLNMAGALMEPLEDLAMDLTGKLFALAVGVVCLVLQTIKCFKFGSPDGRDLPIKDKLGNK